MSDIFDKQKLDPEEQELSDSIKKGEWVSVDNLKEEKRIAKEVATNYFLKKNKEKKISARIFVKA